MNCCSFCCLISQTKAKSQNEQLKESRYFVSLTALFVPVFFRLLQARKNWSKKGVKFSQRSFLLLNIETNLTSVYKIGHKTARLVRTQIQAVCGLNVWTWKHWHFNFKRPPFCGFAWICELRQTNFYLPSSPLSICTNCFQKGEQWSLFVPPVPIPLIGRFRLHQELQCSDRGPGKESRGWIEPRPKPTSVADPCSDWEGCVLLPVCVMLPRPCERKQDPGELGMTGQLNIHMLWTFVVEKTRLTPPNNRNLTKFKKKILPTELLFKRINVWLICCELISAHLRGQNSQDPGSPWLHAHTHVQVVGAGCGFSCEVCGLRFSLPGRGGIALHVFTELNPCTPARINSVQIHK